MMRRESRTFTVEVRRGQKRTLSSVATIEQPAPLPAPDAALDDIFRRAEAALFERPVDHEASASSGLAAADGGVTTGAPAKGRILENLTQVDPLASLMAERVQTSRRGRKPGSKNKPKPLQAQTARIMSETQQEGRVALTPQLVDEALRAMAKVEAPARKYKTQAPMSAGATQTTAAVAEEVAEQNPASPPGAPPFPATVESAPVRTRGVARGRHAVRSEPKPGERWKRRLRGIR